VFWEDFETGREYWGSEETADRDEMVDFATRYDPWPMHLSDAGAAASMPLRCRVPPTRTGPG
jgi:acyl dehydratase